MGEKAPQRRQDDGRLSLLPTLTERKVGPSRFPSAWRQVAKSSRLASGSLGRLGSRIRERQKALCHPLKVEEPRHPAESGGRSQFHQEQASCSRSELPG